MGISLAAFECMTREDTIKRLAELINGIEVAMMTTLDEQGKLRSRPMMTQNREFNGCLWFFTTRDSAKIHQIDHDHRVNLAYADPKRSRYVSIVGKVEHLDDPEKAREFWHPAMRAWFPGGLEDPTLTLVRVDVEQAEYWDTTSSRMMQLAGFVGALATGKRADEMGLGKNKKIDIAS